MRILFALSLFISIVVNAESIAPFTSDGCSAFPDGTLEQRELWLSCCTAHDYAYWQGGTYDDRLVADKALQQCVAEVGEPKIADLMLAGVRVGGSPYFPTSFRWGYGWSYPRFYKALTAEEKEQIIVENAGKDNIKWSKKYLERCELDQQCIEQEYLNRTETLLIQPSLQGQENPVSWCSALSLNETERAICLHANLRVLEKALGVAYGQVKAEKKDFEQQYWLKNIRDICRSDLVCIKNSYKQRITALKSTIN